MPQFLLLLSCPFMLLLPFFHFSIFRAVAENRLLLSRSSLGVALKDSHEGKFISAGRALISSCGFHFVYEKCSLSVDMHGLLGNGEWLGWLLRGLE